MNAIPNTSSRLPCPDQRQARVGSVINACVDPSQEAANEAGPGQAGIPTGPSEVVHFGQACLERRFEAWLHGSQVLDAPLRARYLDSPEHQAEALQCQRRAVREASYVPAGTPLLLT